MLGFAVPAVANAIAPRCDAGLVRSLHALLARRLLAGFVGGQVRHQAELAGHLAASLDESAPAESAIHLMDVADQFGSEAPAQAASWYQATLGRLPFEHPRWAPIVRETMRLFRSQGRYRELGTFAEACSPAIEGADRLDIDLYTDVVLHWVLALLLDDRASAIGLLADRVRALTCPTFSPLTPSSRLIGSAIPPIVALADYLGDLVGGRIPALMDRAIAPVRHWMARPLALLAACGSGSAWARNGHPVRDALDDLLVPRGTAATAELVQAVVHGDLAVLWEAFAGESVVATDFSSTVATLFTRLRRSFVAGRWDDALEAAYQLEPAIMDDPGSRLLRVSRALVAQIHCARGDVRRASDWITLAEGSPVRMPIVAVARCRITRAEEEPERAFTEGVLALGQLHRQGLVVGAEPLLEVLVELAVELGLLNEADAFVEQLNQAAATTLDPRVAMLALRAGARRGGDPHLAVLALELARTIGEPAEVACCCLLLGMVGPGPEPVLKEAQVLYRELGSVSGL